MRAKLSSLLHHVSQPTLKATVLVYFDECHFLSSINPIEGNPRTALDFMCFAMEQCRGMGSFGILLSTNSVFSQLSLPNIHLTVKLPHKQIDVHHPLFISASMNGTTVKSFGKRNTR